MDLSQPGYQDRKAVCRDWGTSSRSSNSDEFTPCYEQASKPCAIGKAIFGSPPNFLGFVTKSHHERYVGTDPNAHQQILSFLSASLFAVQIARCTNKSFVSAARTGASTNAPRVTIKTENGIRLWEISVY